MKDYLKVSYDEKKAPFTDYPMKLASHLVNIFDIKKESKILDIGSGRSEMAQSFKKLNLEVTCLDNSESAKTYAENNLIQFVLHEVKKGMRLPFSESEFDVVFSKSFIEHCEDPNYLVSECRRILKPGGKLIFLTPDWEVNYKIFYDDITHVFPFTKESMKQILELHNFEKVNSFTIRQLPSTWKFPVINKFAQIISWFVPVRTKNKFLRWSRELLLIGFGEK